MHSHILLLQAVMAFHALRNEHKAFEVSLYHHAMVQHHNIVAHFTTSQHIITHYILYIDKVALI